MWHDAILHVKRLSIGFCSIIVVDNIIPFGLEAGDTSTTSDGNSSSLGPFDLSTPVVYYLRNEYQIYVSKRRVKMH